MSKKTKLLTLICITFFVIMSCDDSNNNDHDKDSDNGHNSHNTKENTLKVEKPNRISHTYEQTINGTVNEIMPLYCPIRELDWCENWNPKKVFSNSGLVEKDCIFTTAGHGDDDDVVWIVTEYDIDAGKVEMIYHVPGIQVTKLEIIVTPISDAYGEVKTKAILTYSKISLSETGDKILEDFTKKSYDTMMDSWEKAMNHYLATGEMLTGLPNF